MTMSGTAEQTAAGGTPPETTSRLPPGFIPVLLCCIVGTAWIWVLAYRAPRWASVYQGSDIALPAATRAVIAMSSALTERGLYVLPWIGLVMGGMLALPFLHRSRSNRTIGIVVLALGLCGLLLIVMALILPTMTQTALQIGPN
jgi:type II secretory pathway component PulF